MADHLRPGPDRAVSPEGDSRSGAKGGVRVLCQLTDIPDGMAKGFELGSPEDPFDLFVVRDGDRVLGYRNACPHVGTPLDWQPDTFMSEDGEHIMCHTHGALFEIEDGFCVAGPCAGASLAPVAVRVDETGAVILTDPAAADL